MKKPYQGKEALNVGCDLAPSSCAELYQYISLPFVTSNRAAEFPFTDNPYFCE